MQGFHAVSLCNTIGLGFDALSGAGLAGCRIRFGAGPGVGLQDVVKGLTQHHALILQELQVQRLPARRAFAIALLYKTVQTPAY